MRNNRKIIILVALGIIMIFRAYSHTGYASELAGTQESSTDAAKTCVVSFDGNGSNSDVATITVTSGGYYGSLPELTRSNYVFLGWYTFRSGGTKVKDTTKVINPQDHKLYAHWQGEPVEIELNANGGEVSSTKVKVYYGSKYLRQLPTPTKTSEQFEGWYTSEFDGDKVTDRSIYDEQGPETLYAHWTEKPVKVILIGFNGETYEVIASYGKQYGELPTPTREGYLFMGWYKYKDYTNYRDTTKEVTKDTIVKEIAQVKLYARWYIDPDYDDTETDYKD